VRLFKAKGLKRRKDKKISKEALLAALERAADDSSFLRRLVEDGSMALEDYDLTWEEKAAVCSGDVQWLEPYIGQKLDERLVKRVLIPMLSGERW